MATNFSPCNVMFGMNGFHVSAIGAIQGHHGPLVYRVNHHRKGYFRKKFGKKFGKQGRLFSIQQILHSNVKILKKKKLFVPKTQSLYLVVH